MEAKAPARRVSRVLVFFISRFSCLFALCLDLFVSGVGRLVSFHQIKAPGSAGAIGEGFIGPIASHTRGQNGPTGASGRQIGRVTESVICSTNGGERHGILSA